MSDEKRLKRIFSSLPPGDRETLLSFAEFLFARLPAETIPTEPQAIPRPAEESVINAVKRLSATYPMLDKSRLFHDTSHLVSQHVLHARPAREVIDELEAVFARHYQALRDV